MKDYYSIIPMQESLNRFKNGFRLQSDADRDDATSIAESSLHYKQRIDSMFDERSVVSGTSHHSHFTSRSLKKSLHQQKSEITCYEKLPITNEVQDQINKMFQEVNLTEISKTPKVKKNKSYSVSFLGSIKLNQKVSSLRELQTPLKSLYFDFLDPKKKTSLSSLPSGSLEITNGGLKVKHNGNKNTSPLEQLNPFPSIAVWAAVKFICRKKEAPEGSEPSQEYAFLPLIADPESDDKVSLYQPMTKEEIDKICASDNSDNLPLFVVVIREISKSPEFQCHGFVCSSSNEAIVIAANLYTALVQSMPSVAKTSHSHSDINISLAGNRPAFPFPSPSSKHSIKSTSLTSNKGRLPSESTARLQTKSKSSYSSDSCSNLSSDDSRKKIVSSQKLSREKTRNRDKRRKHDVDSISCARSTRSHEQSLKLSLSSLKICPESQDGDILTKVAIPRSKSFLNAGGPFFSRYSKGLDGIGNNEMTAHHRKNSVGSPLGLNELFQEFKQEGLYSLNDILDAIIDPDGMSFNDLKPIYKEFVLKLALTLTKDELYQRCKSIMQKQKHKRMQVNRQESGTGKKSFTPGFAFKKAIRRSVNNFKLSKYKQSSFEFTSVIFPSCGNNSLIEKNCSKSAEDMSLSMQSALLKQRRKDTKHRRPACCDGRSCSMPHNMHHHDKSSNFNGSIINDDTTELQSRKNYLHNSSSGYFSCSECSFSSNSCSCSSVEKCYCSWGKNNTCYKSNCGPSFLIESDEYSSCECDTDSCFESDKCYCTTISRSTSFQKLKNRSMRSSASSRFLSRSEPSVLMPVSYPNCSPKSRKSSKRPQNIFEDIKGACSKLHSGIQITNSLESIRMEDHGKIYEELVDFKMPKSENKSSLSLFSKDDTKWKRKNYSMSGSHPNLRLDSQDIGSSFDKRQEKKVLLVSARDHSGKVLYMGSTGPGQINNSAAEVSSVHSTEEALSVKKSAEIAAVFRMTDDIIYNALEPPDDFKEKKMYRRSYAESNLETSLGYLP